MNTPAFYLGRVMHKRFLPKPHALTYQVFTLFADLDAMPKLALRNRFFGFNRFNLISFHENDYGNPKGDLSLSLKSRLKKLLMENHVTVGKTLKIWVLTYPKILGFSFNPLTVFYCYGENNTPLAIIYEVRNTFGERHNYIFKADKNLGFQTKHFAKKVFHVSPFFDRKGMYAFQVKLPATKTAVTIDYAYKNEKRLKASFSGKRVEFSDKNILFLTSKMPFMTFKVVVGILFEALLLWCKGLKVFKHPEKHKYQSTPAIGGQVMPKEKTSKEVV